MFVFLYYYSASIVPNVPKRKRKLYFFKSLPANNLQRAIIFTVFLGCGFMPHSYFSWGVLPHTVWGILPHRHKSIFTNSLQRYPPWHYAPPLPWHFAPPWHYAPAFFAHFFILAKFSLFWHDFRPEFYFWHDINPYHQRSYKVPWFCRRKSLVSKGLRRAGWGSVDVSRCHIRG